MLFGKKKEVQEKKPEKKAKKALNAEEVAAVQGGSIGNVQYTRTSSISESVKSRI